MKRIMTALAATTAFAAAPALADHHMDKKDDHAEMDMKGDHMDVSQNDWQNRSKDSTKQFSDYDADSDGDIELSEYLATFDMS